MAYGGLSDVAFFTLNKTTPVIIGVRLTNAKNSATSLFTLKNSAGVTIGATGAQDTKASFSVDPHVLQAANPCVVSLSALPVSQDAGNVTVWIEAFQNGATLAWSNAGVASPQGPYGVNVGSCALGNNCGSDITLM